MRSHGAIPQSAQDNRHEIICYDEDATRRSPGVSSTAACKWRSPAARCTPNHQSRGGGGAVRTPARAQHARCHHAPASRPRRENKLLSRMPYRNMGNHPDAGRSPISYDQTPVSWIVRIAANRSLLYARQRSLRLCSPQPHLSADLRASASRVPTTLCGRRRARVPRRLSRRERSSQSKPTGRRSVVVAYLISDECVPRRGADTCLDAVG
jgi:hypothetical protein